jgi:hypothetical protein
MTCSSAVKLDCCKGFSLCSVWTRSLSSFCFRRRIIPAEKNRCRLCIRHCTWKLAMYRTRKTETTVGNVRGSRNQLSAMYAEAGTNCRQCTWKPETKCTFIGGRMLDWSAVRCGATRVKERPSFFFSLYA